MSTSRSRRSDTSQGGGEGGAYVSRVRELIRGISVKSYIPAAQAQAAAAQKLNPSASAPALGDKRAHGRPASAPNATAAGSPASFERSLRGGDSGREKEERQQWKIERLAERQLVISRPHSASLNPHFHMGPHAAAPEPSSPRSPLSGSSRSLRPASGGGASSADRRGALRRGTGPESTPGSAKPPRGPPPLVPGPLMLAAVPPSAEVEEEDRARDAANALAAHAADLRSEAELYNVAFDEALALVCEACQGAAADHLRSAWGRLANVAASAAAAVDAACRRMRREAQQHDWEMGRSKGQAAELFKKGRECSRELLRARNHITELESELATMRLAQLRAANVSLAPGQDPASLDYDERVPPPAPPRPAPPRPAQPRPAPRRPAPSARPPA
eukprot:tig00000139_g8294.t1